MKPKALIIGNTDGIGLAVTRELLKREWKITGISRSKSQIENPHYEHIISEVQSEEYIDTVKSVIDKEKFIDLCIYCAGIGEVLNFRDIANDIKIFEVNLLGLVKTVTSLIPMMANRGQGHIIGLSSVADIIISSEAPSYSASKAGFSNYLEGLGLAMKSKGISVSNIRFGFVDTKMAKADSKPFMITVERATKHLIKCIEKKPIRYTAPWVIGPLIGIIAFLKKCQIKF